MSVDMCGNKFVEWLQSVHEMLPFRAINIGPSTVNYSIMREAFRNGWVAAHDTAEEKQNDLTTKVKTPAEKTPTPVGEIKPCEHRGVCGLCETIICGVNCNGYTPEV